MTTDLLDLAAPKANGHPAVVPDRRRGPRAAGPTESLPALADATAAGTPPVPGSVKPCPTCSGLGALTDGRAGNGAADPVLICTMCGGSSVAPEWPAPRPSDLPTIDPPAGRVRFFLDNDGRESICIPAGMPVPDACLVLDDRRPAGPGFCWCVADGAAPGSGKSLGKAPGRECPVMPGWVHFLVERVAIATEGPR